MAKLDLKIPDMTLPDGNKVPFVSQHRVSLSDIEPDFCTNQIGYGLGTAW